MCRNSIVSSNPPEPEVFGIEAEQRDAPERKDIGPRLSRTGDDPDGVYEAPDTDSKLERVDLRIGRAQAQHLLVGLR